MTGFLVGLIRKRGNLMQFSNILAYTQDRFDTLRKPNGKPYNTSGNLKRSIMCSLTSNGVFEKVVPASSPQGQTNSSRDINSEIWRVIDEKAYVYFQDMHTKLESQKQKLDCRKRKYPASQKAIKKELAKILAKTPHQHRASAMQA